MTIKQEAINIIDEKISDLCDEIKEYLEDEVRGDLRDELEDDLKNSFLKDNDEKIDKWLNKASNNETLAVIENELERANYKTRDNIISRIKNELVYSVNIYNVDDVSIYKMGYNSWSLNYMFLDIKLIVLLKNTRMIELPISLGIVKVQDNVKNEQ